MEDGGRALPRPPIFFCAEQPSERTGRRKKSSRTMEKKMGGTGRSSMAPGGEKKRRPTAIICYGDNPSEKKHIS